MKDCLPDPSAAAASVTRQLASLRHLDLRQHSIEDLTERVRALLQGQPLRCLEFAPGLLASRVRSCRSTWPMYRTRQPS
jgi:hypothetical protein